MEVLCADKCKQLEEKIKIPMRYIMMALTVVLVLIIYLLTRKCGFFTYCAFFPSLFACMKSMHDNQGRGEEVVLLLDAVLAAAGAAEMP